MIYNKICDECSHNFVTDNPDKKFCSPKCSATYSNRIRKQNGLNKHSEETKAKISESVKKKLKKKIKHCKICGSIIGYCPKPDLCKQYLIRKKSINLKKLGFNFEKIGTLDIIKEYEKLQNYLVDLYVNKKKCLREICDMHGLTSETSLSLVMKMFNLKCRSLSDSLTNSVLQGRSFNITPNQIKKSFKCGWHTTWDNYQVYYRSSYELDFCKQLDKRKVHYEMEFLRIPYFDSQKNKYCVSIPDFYIPSTNEIFEIKSDATYNQINMIDRFRKYKQMGYKNYSLILEHKNYGKRLPKTKKQNSIFY